ncbi:MAG: NAD(P)-dependent glycerol-3-phosphate dehydrogenase [Acidaminococcales bacterium]|jgi:glycerol-3-phosphate dehydrogenase (NAD(P)+)|nr:NAD(P)-dependent glycerol-3-phosphate dehydrogenase [Acidaminococcales bacterium]
MIKTVAVLGAGSWGTALAKLLAEKPALAVKLWARSAELAKDINAGKQNPRYLQGVVLPGNLEATADLCAVLPADLIICALPSQALRPMARRLSQEMSPGQMIVSCAKGLEDGTFCRMSQIIGSECPLAAVAALSGPNHANEVAARQPTATVVACADENIAKQIQAAVSMPYFRAYTNKDITGVELGGALKNIIAIALGLLNGLGYQDNIKAAAMTRGLAEISRLGVALGANPATFLGLAGMGDLISTCTSKHSRNRWAGEQLAKGRKVEDILAGTNMVVEGIKAISSAYALSAELSVEMPITKELYHVIYEGKDISAAVADLMNRGSKSEG